MHGRACFQTLDVDVLPRHRGIALRGVSHAPPTAGLAVLTGQTRDAAIVPVSVHTLRRLHGAREFHAPHNATAAGQRPPAFGCVGAHCRSFRELSAWPCLGVPDNIVWASRTEAMQQEILLFNNARWILLSLWKTAGLRSSALHR